MTLGSVTGVRPDVAWGAAPWFGDAGFLGAVSAAAPAEACLRTLAHGHDLDTDETRERFAPWFHALDVVSERDPAPESLAAMARLPLGTVHPWVAVVEGDLALCLRWRALDPGRGAGRLLWMCERMATPPLASDLVPRMWHAARARGVDAPDRPGTTPLGDCALSADRYRALLAERATGTRLTLQDDTVLAWAPPCDRVASGWLAAYAAVRA